VKMKNRKKKEKFNVVISLKKNRKKIETDSDVVVETEEEITNWKEI